jgi:hypothetical protein
MRQLPSAKLTSRSSSASCLMIKSRGSPSSATTSATSSKNSSNSRVRNRRLRRRRKRSAPRECHSHRLYPDAVLQQLAIIDGHGPPSPMRQVSVPAMIGRATARGRRNFFPALSREVLHSVTVPRSPPSECCKPIRVQSDHAEGWGGRPAALLPAFIIPLCDSCRDRRALMLPMCSFLVSCALISKLSYCDFIKN